MSPITRLTAGCLLLGLVVAGCGSDGSTVGSGSGSGAGSGSGEGSVVSAPESSVTELADGSGPAEGSVVSAPESSVTEPVSSTTMQEETASTLPADTVPTPVPFDGPRFDVTADPVIDALAAPIGQPFSPDAVAGVFAFPADAPLLTGATITGVLRYVAVDSFDDEITDERNVGLDAPGDQASLQAFFDAVPSDGAWTPASVGTSDPYTTLLFTNAADLRHVIVGNSAPDAGEPSTQYELSGPAEAIPTPVWLASLPVPAGGAVTEVTEGVGAVDRLGVLGGDGVLVARVSYPAELGDSLVDQLSPGRFLGAGFELLSSPISNLASRVDVRLGRWEGTVGIGEVTSGDEVLELQVIYTFRRTLG